MANKKDSFLLPALLIGGGIAAFFAFKNSGGSSNPFLNFTGGRSQSIDPGTYESPDLVIPANGTENKPTVIEKVGTGLNLLNSVRDVLTDIKLPGGGTLRIRKGNKRSAASPDNFDVDQEDAADVLNSIKTGNPLTMSKTIARVAAKNGKKGRIKKNGQGSRAVKTIAKKARPVKKSKPVKKSRAGKKSRPVLTKKHFL